MKAKGYFKNKVIQKKTTTNGFTMIDIKYGQGINKNKTRRKQLNCSEKVTIK